LFIEETSMTDDILIIGGGIGGLTLALMLHQASIPCRVYEAVDEFKPLGVGINLLPHATRALSQLGLQPALAKVAVTTKESAFYNRHGQRIFAEACGLYGGYDWPQFSIHRADLHQVLLDAVVDRIGADRVQQGWRATEVTQDATGATVHFVANDGREMPAQRGALAVDCSGIHSPLRKALYPQEGPPRYSGINMWRGVTRAPAYLTGASMVRIGWLNTAKVLIYPIRDNIDGQGTQLINWVVDVAAPVQIDRRDWNQRGRIEDFLPYMADWHFDWLDVVDLCERADFVLEYPMVDQDPLPAWTFGRLTLLGDAAHPMYPRGANGSAQSILDCIEIVKALRAHGLTVEALQAYEAVRRPATAKVVLTNRTAPPDAILREVSARTNDERFERIEDVISHAELVALSESYQKVAGYDHARLQGAA
jgi:2-polyprenyl-6-methoxyphenol hydroxylase-like FAD-dependent oxidoreductase